jgi:hypothetical protein
LRVRTLPFSGPRPHMSISEFSATRVTLTLLQPHLISSLLALPGVSFMATPLITNNILLASDMVLPRPFYLNNILLASDMVQSLLSVRRFTTDNWYSMEFDLFGLTVKDLTTKNVIVRSNSTGPLYTMRLLGYLTPSYSVVAALAAVPHALTAVAPTTWHRRLGYLGADALSSLSRSSFIQCTSNKHDFCHACQLGRHTRLPFCSSSHRAGHAFDLIHLDLWTSSVVSVSSSKYYLIILDDFIHYLWTFPLKLKSDTFTTLSNFFAYVSN